MAISSNQFILEPNRADIYHRDLVPGTCNSAQFQNREALVSQNLFAYSYYSGAEKKTKLSMVRLEASTHKMTAIGEPTVLSTGYNSFVGALSLPSGPQTPSTFTYMQPVGKSSMAMVCGVRADGSISGCKEVAWAEAELLAAQVVKLLDGRLFFAFIQKGGRSL